MSGNGRSAWGPGEVALRTVVSEGLAPGSWGVKGQLFQPLLGPTSCLGEKTEGLLAGNSPFPVALFPLALACWERPMEDPSGWISPAPLHPLGSPGGDLGPLCHDSKTPLSSISPHRHVAIGELFSACIYYP